MGDGGRTSASVANPPASRFHSQYPPEHHHTAGKTRLAFAAFLAGLKVASMPLVILGVRGTKPALASVAEDCSGLIARLVQSGDRFTRRLGFFVWILAGCLRFHDDTRAAILLPSGNPGKDQRRARSLRTASSISVSNSPRVSRTCSPPSFASLVTGNSAPPPGGGVTK